MVKTVVKEVEKADPSLTPRYGGTGILLMNDWLNLDPYRYEYYSNWTASHWAEKLIIGDWAIDRQDLRFHQWKHHGRCGSWASCGIV